MMRVALTALSLLALGAPAWAAPLVVTAPQQAPAGHDRPRIFLSGSIDMGRAADWQADLIRRSEEHTSELQSLMRTSYAVFCLKKKNKTFHNTYIFCHQI